MKYASCLIIVCLIWGGGDFLASSNVYAQQAKNIAGNWSSMRTVNDPACQGCTLRETLFFAQGRRQGETGPKVMRTGFFDRVVELFDPSNQRVGVVEVQSGRWTQERGRELESNVLYMEVTHAYRSESLTNLPDQIPEPDELMFSFPRDARFAFAQGRNQLMLTSTDGEEETTEYSRSEQAHADLPLSLRHSHDHGQ